MRVRKNFEKEPVGKSNTGQGVIRGKNEKLVKEDKRKERDLKRRCQYEKAVH